MPVDQKNCLGFRKKGDQIFAGTASNKVEYHRINAMMLPKITIVFSVVIVEALKQTQTRFVTAVMRSTLTV